MSKSARIAASRGINERALLDKQMAADYLAVSLRTFSRMAQSSDFPKPILVHNNMERFRRLDLDRYIEQLPQSRLRNEHDSP